MKIGIIGAGVVGCTIGSLAVKTGHQVMLSNSRGPRTLFSLPSATGCQIGTVQEAIRFGDIVIVAVPLHAYRDLPADLLAGKIVIDTNNYYPARDNHIDELDQKRTTTSELLAQHLPTSRVTKAFNAVIMKDLETGGRPANAADRRALPIAGDDDEGKKIASALLDEFGFDVVDVGPLTEGWRFEQGTPAYCVPLDKTSLIKTLAETQR